eukprot:759459-Hanusia_phi.AAC.1
MWIPFAIAAACRACSISSSLWTFACSFHHIFPDNTELTSQVIPSIPIVLSVCSNGFCRIARTNAVFPTLPFPTTDSCERFHLPLELAHACLNASSRLALSEPRLASTDMTLLFTATISELISFSRISTSDAEQLDLNLSSLEIRAIVMVIARSSSWYSDLCLLWTTCRAFRVKPAPSAARKPSRLSGREHRDAAPDITSSMLHAPPPNPSPLSVFSKHSHSHPIDSNEHTTRC